MYEECLSYLMLRVSSLKIDLSFADRAGSKQQAAEPISLWDKRCGNCVGCEYGSVKHVADSSSDHI